MSNNFSLMLSLIFLSFFLMLTSEVIAYQHINSKALAQTTEIALYIEKNGYDEESITDLNYFNYFQNVDVKTSIDSNSDLTVYTITTTKKYTTLTTLFEYLNTNIVCQMYVCRKE